jgi:hypothetical protein
MMLCLLEAYVPFRSPIPGIWDYWYLLLIPLCLAVAVVYKAIKCQSIRQVPREAALTTIWMLLAIAVGAAVLTGIVEIL